MYGGNLNDVNDVELCKGARVMQCSLDLELHIPYGGNLNDGNDVELYEGACIYNKDCVCYAVLLDLELLCIYYFYYHLMILFMIIMCVHVCTCMYVCPSYEAHSV